MYNNKFFYSFPMPYTKIKSMVKHLIGQGTNKSRSISKMSQEVKSLHFSSSRNRVTKRISFPQIMIRTILFIGMCKEGNSVGFIFHFQIHTRSKIFFENMVLSNPPSKWRFFAEGGGCLGWNILIPTPCFPKLSYMD